MAVQWRGEGLPPAAHPVDDIVVFEEAAGTAKENRSTALPSAQSAELEFDPSIKASSESRMPDGPELNMTAPSSQSPLPLASSSPLSPIPGQDVEVHLLEAAPLVATNRSVHFDDTEPVVFETFAKSEYERVMDAGPEFSHVSELFEANGELKEQEQEQEVVESLEPLRWLGVCVERRPHQLGFGMKLACVPRLSPASPAYLYAEAVIIQALVEGDAAASCGSVRVGDRIIKINGQTVLCLQQATYFVEEAFAEQPCIDLVITRGEPKSPAPDMEAMGPSELVQLAFSAAGYRLQIVGDAFQVDGSKVSKSMALTMLANRFQTQEHKSLLSTAMKPGIVLSTSSDDCSDTSGDEFETDETDNEQANSKQACSDKAGSEEAESEAPLTPGNRSVQFDEAEPVVFETFAKGEYERVMDAGPEFSHVSKLFEANGQLKEQEQEKEVIESVESFRWYGICLLKPMDQEGFGLKLDFLPRLSPQSPDYLYAEVVLIKEMDPGGAAAGCKELRLGDRIIKINGQFILGLQQANYFVHKAYCNNRRLDIVITRGEEKEVIPDLQALDGQELAALAFSSGGVRLRVVDNEGSVGGSNVTKSMAVAQLESRYRSMQPIRAPSVASSVPDDDDMSFTTASPGLPLTPFPPGALAKNGSDHSIFFDAEDSQAEFEKEVLLQFAPYAWHGVALHKTSDDHPVFGLSLSLGPLSVQSQTRQAVQPVIVKHIAAGSPAAAHGEVQVGDYLVRINGRVPCSVLEAGNVLAQAWSVHGQVDMVLCRLKELPPAPDFSDLDDLQLEQLAFSTAAYRVRIVPADAVSSLSGQTRWTVLDMLAPRFEAKSYIHHCDVQLSYDVLQSEGPNYAFELLWLTTKHELAASGQFTLDQAPPDTEA